MAWDFDGVDQYARFTMNATLQAAPGGPMTMAAIVWFDATTDGAVIHMLTSAQASRPWIEMFGNWNYGTTAGARSGPAGVTGAWYLAILSKDTGNVAPEYTLIPLATGTPVSGQLTGGGVTLGDGTASGAGGIIQVARWGTSSTEFIDGRIAATAIWNVYKNQAAREALTTWALWLASAGIQWAVRFNTLATLTDATSLGGGETARFGTASITLAADPGALAIDFFAAGGGSVTYPDTSGGGSSGGSADGVALGNTSGGAGGAVGQDGTLLGDGSSGGSSSAGSLNGVVLGDGSAAGSSGGSGDSLLLGNTSGGAGSGSAGDGLTLGDTSGGSGTGGSPDGVLTGIVVSDSSGGAGSAGSADGIQLGDRSGGSSSGSSGNTVAGGPVTISDTSGGSSSGGSPDTIATPSQVVHDTMVMPILLQTRACLVTEVGKLQFPPARVQLRPGASFEFQADNVTNECCDGIAWVRRGTLTPTGGDWPAQLAAARKDPPGFYAVQLEIGIERCIPIAADTAGTIVTAEQWEQAAINAEDDSAALRRVVCCLREIYGADSIIENPTVPLENGGMCGGEVLTLLVRAPACDCVG